MLIEFLIRQTDAGEMPDNRAISRTPLPAAKPCLASLPSASIWRPTEPDRQSASRSLSAKYAIPACLPQMQGHHGRHVEQRHSVRGGRIQLLFLHPQRYTRRPTLSMNPTNSTRDFPILSMDQINTRSVARDRIASSSANSPGRRS